MRAVFLLLVAANLALYAWFQQFSASDAGTDPEPARRQIQPGKIRLLEGRELKELTGLAPPPRPAPPAQPAPSATPAPSGTAAAPPAAAPSTPATPAQPAAPAAPGSAAQAPQASACVEWGGFATAEAPKAEQALAPLALGGRLSQRRSEETAGWWVFIPPQANRAAALKKTAELKALGIDDYFVIQDDGKLRWAVSLGVFTSEEAARSRLEALRARGVRSAQTGTRGAQVEKVWFQVRGADAPLLARFRDTAQGFPGTEVRSCP